MDFKAGMFVYALAFLAGVLSVQQLAALPALSTLLLLGAVFICGFFMMKSNAAKAPDFKKQITLIMTIILLILIGFIYASLSAKQRLSSRLNDSLAGQNIVVNGLVSNIPVSDGKVQRFEFMLDNHRILTVKGDKTSQSFPHKIRLSWYYGREVKAGERWQLEVRLKTPHGFMNPGGFDYEKWLFQQGIDATGYVRKSALNKREPQNSTSIDSVRQLLSQRIEVAGSVLNLSEINTFSLIKALAIGDKSSISSQQWRVLTNTGTSHLMAISGLHIGLASLFVYICVRRMVPVRVMHRIPAQHVALIGGLFSALLYALMAGMSIPTQRAIIMLLVLSVMVLIRHNHRPVDALGFALLLVILIDPLAVLSAGFWFSFSAVAVIFVSIVRAMQLKGENASAGQRFILILKQWVRLQLLISIFLLPLSLFMFQQVSLISPVANLLLIPYVSFLVVPVVLLAIIFFFLSPYVSDVLFSLAALLLDLVWPVLSYLSSLPYALWIRGDVGVFELLSVTLAMLLIFYRSKISIYLSERFDCCKYKIINSLLWLLSGVSFLAMLIVDDSGLKDGEYRLVVLDVGQGSAAVIQTRNHVLVFDAGARFSDRLNAGSGVVIPYLRSQGIKHLDRLIISHGDADHIGGARAILDEYPEVFLMGRDIDSLDAKHKKLCTAGEKWRWDDVDFIFLSPSKNNVLAGAHAKRNNHSCVLQVIAETGRVLLTGDIEKKVEKELLDKYSLQLVSDIILVPHHGSNTSSSEAFIDTVNPEFSLISAGYKNRYRLPNNKVTVRYVTQGSRLFNTADTGAILIGLTYEAGINIERYRNTARRYWHHKSIENNL